MGRIIAVSVVAAGLVFVGVYLWLQHVTPDLTTEFNNQDSDLSALSAQMENVRTHVPGLIRETRKNLAFIHEQRLKFAEVRGSVRDDTFEGISGSYQLAEGDLAICENMLENLTIPETSEEETVSLLRENLQLFRQAKAAGDAAEAKTKISQNAEKIKTLNDVSDRLLLDLGNIIQKHEEQWLSFAQQLHNLQALTDKDDETLQRINLQNKLLELSGTAIQNERNYVQLLSDVLKKLRGTANVQEGFRSVFALSGMRALALLSLATPIRSSAPVRR